MNHDENDLYALSPRELKKWRRQLKSHPEFGAQGCTLLFMTVWTLFSAVFVVLGIGFYVKEMGDYRLLQETGAITEATVVRKYTASDSDGGTDYYISYQFVASDHAFDRRQIVNRDFYQTIEAEQRIDVIYAPSDPNVSRLHATFAPPSILLPICFSGMGGTFVILGITVLAQSWRAQARGRQLRQHGRLVNGRIVDTWTTTDSDGDDTYHIAYTFTVHDGSEKKLTQTQYSTRTTYARLYVADEVKVLFLPSDPTVNMMMLDDN